MACAKTEFNAGCNCTSHVLSRAKSACHGKVHCVPSWVPKLRANITLICNIQLIIIGLMDK